jgi:hypothetical protein
MNGPATGTFADYNVCIYKKYIDQIFYKEKIINY